MLRVSVHFQPRCASFWLSSCGACIADPVVEEASNIADQGLPPYPPLGPIPPPHPTPPHPPLRPRATSDQCANICVLCLPDAATPYHVYSSSGTYPLCVCCTPHSMWHIWLAWAVGASQLKPCPALHPGVQNFTTPAVPFAAIKGPRLQLIIRGLHPFTASSHRIA